MKVNQIAKDVHIKLLQRKEIRWVSILKIGKEMEAISLLLSTTAKLRNTCLSI